MKGDNLDTNTQEEEVFRKKWKDIVTKEEIFWKQRSRVLWLTEGDRYTSFFHRSASNHKRRNMINVLVDEEGREYREQEDLGKLVVDYFGEVFKKEDRVGNQVIRRSLINSIPHVIGEEENNIILGNITEEEVKKAMFSMKAYKALGPDGFPLAFFQNF